MPRLCFWSRVRICPRKCFGARASRNFDAHYENDVRKCARTFRQMNNPIYLLTFVAALGSGLVAGIFFAFSNFVMRALARIPHGIAAMQSINVVVLNGWFFAVFFGTAGCCLALTISSFVRWQNAGLGSAPAGLLLYIIYTCVAI